MYIYIYMYIYILFFYNKDTISFRMAFKQWFSSAEPRATGAMAPSGSFLQNHLLARRNAKKRSTCRWPTQKVWG